VVARAPRRERSREPDQHAAGARHDMLVIADSDMGRRTICQRSSLRSTGRRRLGDCLYRGGPRVRPWSISRAAHQRGIRAESGRHLTGAREGAMRTWRSSAHPERAGGSPPWRPLPRLAARRRCGNWAPVVLAPYWWTTCRRSTWRRCSPTSSAGRAPSSAGTLASSHVSPTRCAGSAGAALGSAPS